MPSFESPAVLPARGSKKPEQQKSATSRVAVVAMAGMLSQGANAFEQSASEAPQTEPTVTMQKAEGRVRSPLDVGRSVSYNEYVASGGKIGQRTEQKDVVVPQDEAKILPDFRLPLEAKVAMAEEEAKKVLKIGEVKEELRHGLNTALNRLGELSGENPSFAVQSGGGLVVELALQKLDRRLSAKLRNVIRTGLTPDEIAQLDRLGSVNPDRLLFTRTLGGKSGERHWQLSGGLDPGATIGKKWDPKAAVTFRVVFP